MPTRYLKPGICDSDAINRCTPLAECLFYRLLVNVDDFGRIDARPAVIRSKCFPLKDTISNKDVDCLMRELQECGLIILYQVNGCDYLQLQKWDNAPRAKESKCPSPSYDCIQLHTNVITPRTNLPVTVTVTETETETETVNRKPEQETSASALLASLGVSTQTAKDFIKLRKAKRAPITETVMEGISREADKADFTLESALRKCCEKGWQSFDAEWVNKPKSKRDHLQVVADQLTGRSHVAVALD